jgi:hypothetical protein
VAKGYSPFPTAVRDSSMQRVIIVLSVASGIVANTGWARRA